MQLKIIPVNNVNSAIYGRLIELCTNDKDIMLNNISGINAVSIIISDNIDILTNIRSEFKYTMLIYDKLDDTNLDSIDCMIHMNSSTNIIDKCIKSLLSKIKSDYDCWIYKHYLQTILDSSPDMAWFKDLQGRHIILNKEFGNVVDKPVESCLNKEHPDIWGIPWEEYYSSDFACRKSEDEIAKSGKTGVFEEKVLTKGKMKQFITYKSPLYDPFGNLIGTCGIGHDCTDFSNIGLQIDIIISSMPFPIFICDQDFNIIRMNSSAERMTNHYGDDTSFRYLEWKNRYLYKVEEKEYGAVYQLTDNNGLLYIECIEKPINDYFGNATGYFCMFRDITYMRLYEKIMFDAANTDELTGLYNRRYFYNFINDNKNKEMTLIYMDLDHFKEINDNFGHTKGDEVLKKIAEIIREYFSDDINIRLGGDEFATLVIGESDLNEIKDKIKKIKHDVKRVIPRGSVKGFGLSSGIASNDGSKTTKDFVKEADKLMYRNKDKHHSEE